MASKQLTLFVSVTEIFCKTVIFSTVIDSEIEIEICTLIVDWKLMIFFPS